MTTELRFRNLDHWGVNVEEHKGRMVSRLVYLDWRWLPDPDGQLWEMHVRGCALFPWETWTATEVLGLANFNDESKQKVLEDRAEKLTESVGLALRHSGIVVVQAFHIFAHGRRYG